MRAEGFWLKHVIEHFATFNDMHQFLAHSQFKKTVFNNWNCSILKIFDFDLGYLRFIIIENYEPVYMNRQVKQWDPWTSFLLF